MKLFLFHDATALRWTPFIETRPLGEILYGTLLLRERIQRAFGPASTAYLDAPHLTGFDEPGAPPHLDAPDAIDEDRVFLCARAVPSRPEELLPAGPATLYLSGRVVGWHVPAGLPAPDAVRRRRLEPGPGGRMDLRGELLDRPWHLMAGNAHRIATDVAELRSGTDAFQLSGVHLIGSGAVELGAGAVVEPGVVLDTRSGPIWLDRDTRVEGPARITGPFYLGPGSTVLGGALATSSIGPVCKVRGEVADSILMGYVNKAHDGHIGHAVLGRWVNLGAGTVNSDLKNTYASVRLILPEGTVDTGLVKVGAFVGDHVKTGIGTLLNTGTVVGAGTNLFGGHMPPAWVPPFTWGDGATSIPYRTDRFLAVAEAAMARRGVALGAGMRALLADAAERAWSQRGTGVPETP